MSVQVAVRVRPFNQREIDMESRLCVKMEGNQTTLLDLEDSSRDRKFTFDYSFWSHDNYSVQANGLMIGDNDIYWDQDRVYNAVGNDILDNAWKGYHCTLFAYGQTGSGKSYSMMGYKPNVGIVPISCRKMFERIEADSSQQYEVNFSMLEIYNEKVQDLFVNPSNRPANGMKIRESPSLGFYAEGLRKYPVKSFNEIEQRMDEGSKNRSVAATQMNATSSRAHTIVLIEMKQKNGKAQKLSVMNLVDLAGSEKVGKTGAQGDRLKEASAINKSLSMLGLVISTLAEHASGKNLNAKIPYRDSVLTRLLKNALGGNSKTVMICAISPAQDNYEETLSTLRYADQAKKIKNKAIVNESAQDKLIRELRIENKRLNDLVKDFESKMQSGQYTADNPEAMKKFQELKDLQENVEANEKLLQNEEKTEDERLKELQEQEEKERQELEKLKVDENLPFLTNLNEDDQLNGQVKYQIAKDSTQVGRKNKNPEDQPDIVINGLGIKPKHCQFVNENGKVYLVPGDDPKIKDNLYLNGEKVTDKIEVLQNDRVIIGQNATFLVKIPNGQPREGTPDHIDWELAHEEITKQSEKLKQQAERDLQQQFNQEMAAKLKAMEEKHAEELAQYQEKLAEQDDHIKDKDQEQDKEQLLKAEQLREEMEKNRIEAENKYNEDKKKLNAQKFINKVQAAKEKKKLEKELADIVPKVNEMNMIADELDRKIKFLVQVKNDEEEKIKILVKNDENNSKYTWDKKKAIDRYYLLLDKLAELEMTGEVEGKGDYLNDPFWDFADPILGGKGQLDISLLLHRQEIPMEIRLYDRTLIRCIGLLKVHLYETDVDGNVNYAQQSKAKNENLQDPNVLSGKKMYLKVKINSAKLPPNIYNSYVEYKLFGKVFRTEVNTDRTDPIYYQYEKIHHIKEVDDYVLTSLAKDNIHFTVYGQIDPNEDPVFRGKLDEVLTFKNIDVEAQQVKGSNGLIGQDPYRGVWIRKKHLIAFSFALLSFILYMVQLILASVYRAHYDNLIEDFEDKASTVMGEEHYGFWRSFSLMLISCTVMMSYYAVSFLVNKCLFDYVVEFVQLNLLPFLIWFISSVVWLSIDEEYQNYQQDLSNAWEKGELCDQDQITDEVDDLCAFAESRQKIVNFTIYMLVFNTIIFGAYYFTVIKYLQGKRQVQEQRRLKITSNNKE